MSSGEGSAPGEPASGDAWSLPEGSETCTGDRVFGTGERYERRGELGRGGMGRVWAAKDRRLRREVALKEAHSPALARRMAREAWITGHLEHPGIVPVYDAGHSPSGTPYYTMRLIRGRTLQVALADAAHTDDRLALLPHFHHACQAMAYAHSVGIVHRDLKPANILVGEFGETQVADWGLARPIQGAAQSWSASVLQGAEDTQVGSVVGTPRYMAPEQARGQPADARSDVWSLGMVLFELLAGAPAYASRSAEETLEQVRTGALPDLDTLAPDAPVELRAVVRHACQQDPDARYATALELAQDVERWLDGRQVRAHDYTPLQLMARLVRAWRAPLVVATVATLGLLSVGVVAGVRIAEQRDRAEAALAEADASLSDALAAQALASLRAGARPEAEILAAHALLHGDQPDARGVLAAFASTPRPTRLSKTPLSPACQQGRVQLDAAGDRMACTGADRLEVWSLYPLVQVWGVDELSVDDVSWAADGESLTVVHHHDYVKVDAATGAELARLPELGVGQPVAIDADHVLSLIGTKRTVWTWTGGATAQGEEPGCAVDRTEPLRVGDRLLAACRNGEVAWLDLDGRMVVKLADLQDDAPLNSVGLRGQRVLIAGGRGSSLQLDAQTGEVLARVTWPTGAVMQAVPIPETDRVLLRGHRGEARVWHPSLGLQGSLPSGALHIASGQQPGQVLVFSDHLEVWQFPLETAAHSIPLDSGVACVQVDPRGELVAIATGSSRVTVVERGTGRRAWRVHKPGAGVAKAVAWSPNGSHIAGQFMEGGFNVYDRDGALILDDSLVMRRLGSLSDGRWFGLSYGQGLRTLDPVDQTWHIQAPDQDWLDAAVGPTHDHAVVVSRTWDLCTLAAGDAELVCHGRMADAIAVDVDATGHGIWAGRQQQVCTLGGACADLDSRVLDIALSPDDSLIAAATMSGDVALLDTATLTLQAMLRGHTKQTVTLSWSPDGRELYSGSWDATVRVWSLDVLDAKPEQLVQELEQAWGMTLDQALH